MNVKVKASLILIVMIALVTGLVFAVLYGFGRDSDSNTKDAPLPSDAAAKAYVLDHKLLKEVTDIQVARVGGPVFKAVRGLDNDGQDRYVWLIGKNTRIENKGTALVKEAVAKDTIIAKAKEKGIDPADIESILIAPYDYTSGKIVWFVRDKGVKHHMLWFDFKTGDLFWEGYEDPTAWTINGR